MKSLIAIIMLTLVVAHAACYGNNQFVSCDDGNIYARSGNTWMGSNPNTGSNWSQTQQGNTTYYNDSKGGFHTCTQYGNTRQCF